MSNASVLNTPPSHRILHAQAYVGLKVDHRAADLGDVFQLPCILSRLPCLLDFSHLLKMFGSKTHWQQLP